MPETTRPLAVVTGASAGIGYELALLCAQNGFDLVVASDEVRIRDVAAAFREAGAEAVEAVQADLGTIEGNDALCAAVVKTGRPVEVLLANAGRGLGRGFFDQDWSAARRVIDVNVLGTTYLLHRLGAGMRDRKAGRILVTGSIAGFMPGSFQAIYNGSKAYLNSLAFALREELKNTGVTVTVLEPGPTETEFFKTADMMDTDVGTGKKDEARMVAQKGFEAMMEGSSDVTTGLKNKVQAAIANVLPNELLASAHRKMAEPGTAG